MRSPSVVACCFAALITLMGSVVAAEPTLRWSASGSFESFVAADLLGHGAVVVEALHTSDSGASLRAEFNTETLTLEAGRRFARGEVRGGLRGEFGALPPHRNLSVAGLGAGDHAFGEVQEER